MTDRTDDLTARAPTNMTAEWISNAVAKNPAILMADGNIRTCPVRLGFPYLLTAQKAMEEGKPDKFSAALLFPGSADLTIIKEEMVKCGREKWGDKFPEFLKADGFHNPIQDQAKKSQFQGFTPGHFFVTATGERKPPVQDARGALITDASKIYPGVWAFAVIRPFAFETKNRQGAVLKRGLGFGLQAVMIAADDVAFGGGGVDAEKAFSGVSLQADMNPDALFSGSTGGAKGDDNLAGLL